MRILALVGCVAVAATASANTLPVVTSVSATTAGDTVLVRFDVVDPDGDDMTIHVRAGGSDLRLAPSSDGISGDVGPGLVSGEGYEIRIALSLLEEPLPDPFVPRILAHDGRGYGGEVIAVSSTTGPDFQIDKYELTNEQFAEFVHHDGYEVMEYWMIDDGTIEIVETGWNYAGRFQWGAPRYWDRAARPPWSADPYSSDATSPVLGVSWFECYAYCRWAGRRLPTSGEWREGANVLHQPFPWGDELEGSAEPPVYSLANIKLGYEGYTFDGFTTDGHEVAAPVGSYSPAGDSPLGLADVVGNVWEWCDDVVAVVDYGTFSCATRPIRGGSWATPAVSLDDATRDLCPLYRTEITGFRCAR